MLRTVAQNVDSIAPVEMEVSFELFEKAGNLNSKLQPPAILILSYSSTPLRTYKAKELN